MRGMHNLRLVMICVYVLRVARARPCARARSMRARICIQHDMLPPRAGLRVPDDVVCAGGYQLWAGQVARARARIVSGVAARWRAG